MHKAFLKIFTVKAIGLYLITILTISILWSQFFIGWQWILWGALFVGGFFGFNCFIQQKWACIEPKIFVKRLFLIALCLRVVYVVIMCYYYYYNTGYPFEYEAADSLTYHRMAVLLSQGIRNGHFAEVINYLVKIPTFYSDLGYVSHLTLIYSIFDKNILIPRLIKALMGAYVCVMVYRLSKRTFDEKTARVASIMTMLMPTLLYYTGVHLKETEMMFWAMLFLDRTDFLLKIKSRPAWNIFLIIISLLMVFGYRNILGVCLMFSFLVNILLSSEEILKKKTKVLIISCFFIFFALIMMTNIGKEIISIVRVNFSENQYIKEKYERLGMGYSQYANGKYMFPGAFVLPLSPMTNQCNDNQKILHGAMYDKNYLAFFAMLAIFISIKRKSWRKYSLIGSFTISYLAVIVLSPFFNSERYYFPVLPCLLIMAGYAMTRFERKHLKIYYIYLAVLFIALIGWNYIKLDGRGLI